MQMGVIGLGRMGMNMARRLIKGNHDVVVYNRTQEKVKTMEKEGAKGTSSLEELVQALKAPRIIWIMLPAGEIVDQHIQKLKGLMSKGDILIDGETATSEMTSGERKSSQRKAYATWMREFPEGSGGSRSATAP